MPPLPATASRRALLLLALVGPAAGCVAEITSREAHGLVDQGARLLDVRSAAEYQEGHVPGAISVPLEELDRRLPGLPRDRPLLVYCHTGVRARIAVVKLRRAGFTAVHNLATMSRWREDPRTDISPLDWR